MLSEPVGGLLDAAEGIRDSVTGIADAASGLVNNVESAIDTVGNTMQTVAGVPGQALENLKACNPFAESANRLLQQSSVVERRSQRQIQSSTRLVELLVLTLMVVRSLIVSSMLFHPSVSRVTVDKVVVLVRELF